MQRIVLRMTILKFTYPVQKMKHKSYKATVYSNVSTFITVYNLFPNVSNVLDDFLSSEKRD